MKRVLWLIFPFIAYIPLASADEPQPVFDGCHWRLPKLSESWRQRACWCPNDYCPKPLPCVPASVKGCGDDFCRKPLPCVPPNVRGCGDDYCRKTYPLFLGGLCEPWYSCGGKIP